jgi:hypothetical protein
MDCNGPDFLFMKCPAPSPCCYSLWSLPCNVHLKSQLEVRITYSGLVTGCYSLVASNAWVASWCSSRFCLAVVKSIKTKPPGVNSLELLLLQVACGRHHRKALLATHCLRSTFFPSFKSCCKSSRKSEWCPPLPMRQCACRPPLRLGSLLLSVGRPKCHKYLVYVRLSHISGTLFTLCKIDCLSSSLAMTDL